MNHFSVTSGRFIKGFLGLLAVVGAVLVSMYYQDIFGFKKTDPCEECKAQGGKCNLDKDGNHASCSIHPHGNPHKGGETFVAQHRDDAMYTYYGVPNFPL